jgi:DNA-binding beta-propeller fold protein YncE
MIKTLQACAALALAGSVIASGATWSAARAGAPRTGPPLTLLKTVPIPDVTKGDFDHFAVDFAGNRLYVSAEVHHSIEVFDLASGAHVRSGGAVTTPHTLAFVPSQRALFVADGGDASVKVLAADDLHQLARIPLAGNPDAGLYDAVTRTFFVGTTKKGSKTSTISMISVDRRRQVGAIAVRSGNIESMVIDRATDRLIVNLRDKKDIGIIDLARRRLVDTWSIASLNRNTPMQLDQRGRRLFVAGRQPGTLFVIDADGGRLIARLPCVETADGMSYDAAAHRIYVSGVGGLDVFAQDDADRYRLLARYDTYGGKTSVEVPELRRFFVVHTKSAAAGAGLQVFRINQNRLSPALRRHPHSQR